MCIAYTPLAAWAGYIKTSSVRTTGWVLVCGWETFMPSWIAWTTLATLGLCRCSSTGRQLLELRQDRVEIG